MRKQLNNFCKKFLLDDTIKNLLIREAKRYARDKDKLGGHYPFKMAQELARKLRTLADDENYLDTIRKRITQIGNTLGFVRMIKNASLKDNQNLLKFIPKLFDSYTFEDVANDLAIGGETQEAMKMFDQSVRHMQQQGEDANDYMRKMVTNNEGFADDNEQTLPLKNFYAIVPAVSTCYVDYIVNGRNKLKQRDNKDAFISDDGFALGVVYLLRILKISDEFASLNWFDSIEAKLRQDIKVTKSKKKAVQYQGTTQNAYDETDNFEEEQLSIKDKENKLMEYSLLNYGITSASILFKEI